MRACREDDRPFSDLGAHVSQLVFIGWQGFTCELQVGHGVHMCAEQAKTFSLPLISRKNEIEGCKQRACCFRRPAPSVEART
jgi:hypothetical protein